MRKKDLSLETIVTLAKSRGFVFPGSEIYGGLANSWDYGPIGVLLKNHLRDAWWNFFVEQRGDMFGIDAAILMNPKVWEASGHVKNFTDPMVECKHCHKRFRVDQEPFSNSTAPFADIPCPNCETKGQYTEPRQFNLLFETELGSVVNEKQKIYLRGELAQAMFVDFKRVVDAMHPKLPFGIAQVGRVFRNEITPGNFTYRTLEFDLMEFEYFIREAEWEASFEYWVAQMKQWFSRIGIPEDALRVREQAPDERAHYSKRTVDLEYETPFGWKELGAVAYRTDFDVKQHAEASGLDLRYTDPHTQEKFFPHVIEPTVGLTRLLLFALLEAYDEEEVNGEKRVVLRLAPQIAPYQVAVLPLSKKDELTTIAKPLADQLRQRMSTDYDETQSIGKRYRRQDEIGTPWCVTVDFETRNDQAVTIRDRDSMQQERIPIAEVPKYLQDKMLAHS